MIKCITPLKNRILFQNNTEFEETDELSSDDTKAGIPRLDVKSPVFETKLSLKRKLESKSNNVRVNDNVDVINIISDTDTDSNAKDCMKKMKVDQPEEFLTNLELKKECEDIQYEAFNVKQEYLGYDELIEINSDSDSESELFVRLSQSSPSKPYTHHKRIDKSDKHIENSSYSQLDDDVIFDVDDNMENIHEEDFIDDIITIPTNPPENEPSVEVNVCDKFKDTVDGTSNNLVTEDIEIPSVEINTCDKLKDTAISINLDTEPAEKIITPLSPPAQTSTAITKKTQMIEPLIKPTRRKSHVHQESKNHIYIQRP